MQVLKSSISKFIYLTVILVLVCGCVSLKGKDYSLEGQYYFAHNNFKEAVQYYVKAVETDTERQDYLSMLGWSYFKLGDYDKAIVIFQRLAQINEFNLDAYTGRGWCNFKKSNFDEAISYFVKALDIDKNSSESFAGLGWCIFRKGDIAKAEEYFNIALAKGLRYKSSAPLIKTEPEAHRGLGYLKFSKGDFKNALIHFKAATTLMPDWNDTRIKWGDCLFSLAKYKDAIGVYQHALKYDKSAAIYDKMGWGYFYLGDYKRARSMFGKALAIDPAYASSLSGLSEIEKKSSSN